MARTEIQNLVGQEQFFGFIPPHGRTLDADETITLDGDLRTTLAGGRNRYGRPAELAAYDEAISAGDIAVTELDEPESSSSSSSSA
jgi:hypothetical protein